MLDVISYKEYLDVYRAFDFKCRGTQAEGKNYGMLF